MRKLVHHKSNKYFFECIPSTINTSNKIRIRQRGINLYSLRQRMNWLYYTNTIYHVQTHLYLYYTLNNSRKYKITLSNLKCQIQPQQQSPINQQYTNQNKQNKPICIHWAPLKHLTGKWLLYLCIVITKKEKR